MITAPIRASLLCFNPYNKRFSSVSSIQRFSFFSRANSTALATGSAGLKLCFGDLCSNSQISGGVKVGAEFQFDRRSMSISSSNPSPVTDQLLMENGVQPTGLLIAVNDEYGGVIIEMEEPMDSEVFRSSLSASLSQWRKEGKRGVWIKLPIEHANLVEPAVKEGFWYHHAEPKYLMLVHWLPETENTLPANASHRVGICAFVMNDEREVLVVQENAGKFKGTGVWKFPTGVIEQGEDVSLGAVREVKEETGIDTEFVEVLAFRQSHKSFYEKSDLFFVCMLRPLSFDIQKQESEIEDAKWMPVDEFTAQPFWQREGLPKHIVDVCLAKMDKGYAGFAPTPTITSSNQSSYMYMNCQCLNQPSSSRI
ncbi:hypothetical protein Syun_010700 [Stephania yunnanensis]|uniref:Nudix hydrolase domain-containing protein n=1 Tax=Stephania yunnanensis TaxID=152371 RepID=A0AAP0KGZ9_9MAGN